MCEYQVWRISDPKLWGRILSCIHLFRLAINTFFFIFRFLFLLSFPYIRPRYLTVALLILPGCGNRICKSVGIDQDYCLSHRWEFFSFVILHAYTSLTGFRVRTRSVIKESSMESDSCPHVSEAMTCDDPVCFQWRVTSLGPCVPQNGSCGPGFQEQTLECLSATGMQLTFPFSSLFTGIFDPELKSLSSFSYLQEVTMCMTCFHSWNTKLVIL